MHVNHNSAQPLHNLPGLEHQTLVNGGDGIKQFEIWRQTIAPHAATPVHRHDCEEVITIFAGNGACHCNGETFTFGADDTLVIPPNVVHQICNTGDEALQIMAVLSMSPVRVETSDGEPLDLPWDYWPEA